MVVDIISWSSRASAAPLPTIVASICFVNLKRIKSYLTYYRVDIRHLVPRWSQPSRFGGRLLTTLNRSSWRLRPSSHVHDISYRVRCIFQVQLPLFNIVRGYYSVV